MKNNNKLGYFKKGKWIELPIPRPSSLDIIYEIISSANKICNENKYNNKINIISANRNMKSMYGLYTDYILNITLDED